MIKIARFSEDGSSTPLYEQNVSIDESSTTMVVNIKIKASAVFLFSVKIARLIILSFQFRLPLSAIRYIYLNIEYRRLSL